MSVLFRIYLPLKIPFIVRFLFKVFLRTDIFTDRNVSDMIFT